MTPVEPDVENEDGPGPAKPRGQPIFNIPASVSVLLVVLVAVHALESLVLSDSVRGWIRFHLSVIPLRFTAPVLEPFWPIIVSPVTHAFLHGGWEHVLFNAFWMVAFGAPLAHRLGTVRFAAFWLVGALGGAAAHILTNPESTVPMIGASGAVSALIAAAARFGFTTAGAGRMRAYGGKPLGLVQMAFNRTVVSFIAIWLAINLAMAFGFMGSVGSGIAWQAHLGGFLAGLILLPAFVTNGQHS